MHSPQRIARMAGFWYLTYILTTAIASFLRSRLISADATTTAQKILASQGLYRLAFSLDILSAVFFLMAAWSLYVLLKTVNQELALLFLVLNLCGVGLQAINSLNLLAGLLVLNGEAFLKAFQPDQVQALAMGFINLYSNGFILAQIFFGSWLFPLGWLVYRSGLLPRFLGLLLLLDGVGVLVWFFQFFLLPGYPGISYPSYVIGFIAEFGLALWLVIKGVKSKEPASIMPG